MKKAVFKRRSGALIIEAMISILLFGMLASAAFSGLITGQESSQVGSDRVRAGYLTDKALEVMKSLRDSAWTNISGLTADQEYGYNLQTNGTWTLSAASSSASSGSLNYNGYRTTVKRTVNGYAQRINALTTWKHGYHRPGRISLSLELTNWREFSRPMGLWGSPSNLGNVSASNSDSLRKMALSDDGKFIFVGGAAGLYVFEVNHASPDTLPIQRSPAGFSPTDPVLDLVVYSDKLYVLTTQAASEIKVYNVGTPASSIPAPSTIDLPGNGLGLSLFSSGPYLYVGMSGDDEFQIYNANSPFTKIGGVNYNASVNDIYVMGTGAYLATGEKSNNEIVVFDVTNPALPTEVDAENYSATISTGTAQEIALRSTHHYLGYSNAYRLVEGIEGELEAIPGDGVIATSGVNDMDVDPQGCFVFLALQGADAVNPSPPPATIPAYDFQIHAGNSRNAADTDPPYYREAYTPDAPAQGVIYNPWIDRAYVTAGINLITYKPGAGVGSCP